LSCVTVEPVVAHRFVPGAHTPHVPVAALQVYGHATGAPHCPLASQVCTPLPEHRVAPGVHVHAPVVASHA
jgi:hypothetical protein